VRPGQRFGLSAIEKNEIWRRWKAGQTLHEIGRAFDKPHSSLRCLLLPRGGIPPKARRRSRLALTRTEREDISRGIASGSSIREIARHLDRAASTVSREVARHGGRPAFRAHDADQQAWVSALRPKKCLLAVNRKLRDIVASKLILDWSPEQISGWLKTRYPNNESMHVSHETIYRSLFIQARGALKKELMDHLRSKRRMRRSRHSSEHGHSRGQIVDAISIRERPAEPEDRPLGRRSAGRGKEQLHCDVSGAAFTLPHADQGAEQRNGSGGCRLESACSETSCDAAPLADLGSRIGDGQAQGVYGCYRCAGLLLRSTKSLATRLERKHQSAPAAILPARNRPSSPHSSAARPSRAALESTSKKNSRISNSSE
jgi:transposase-like protein